MSTQKAKFELFSRLRELGFTYDESAQLRRIEMTLQRWAEEECNGTIQRAELEDGRPYRYRPDLGPMKFEPYSIADREAGALRRLKAIIFNRNKRVEGSAGIFIARPDAPEQIVAYHQSDPRGCALYLVTRAQLGDAQIEQVYSRGVAVCC